MKNVKLASILLSYTYQTQPDEMELVLGDIDFNSFIDFIEDDEFCSETLNEDSYKETCDKIINYLKEKEYKIPLLKKNK